MDFRLSTLDHHAYCLEGDFSITRDILFKELEKLKFQTKSNPDFWHNSYETFGIDDAHRIQDFQNKKAFTGDKKFIVLEAKSLTREAQNSLLKTFEEPSFGTHFFLIIPNTEILLDTLKSRLLILKGSEIKDDNIAEKFLKSSKKERLDLVKSIAEEKDKLKAIKLLNQIEKIIYEKSPPLGGPTAKWGEDIELLETINKFRSYLNDRSPSIKMLLEHIALVAPKI